MTEQRRLLLTQSAADFFYLQNRTYPRASALEWVGNRYGLTHQERQLLHRGVFAQEGALRRRSKRCIRADWQEGCLVVDGHNVQITVESALLDRPLLKANDGAVRDLAGQSARFRLSEVSETALDLVFRYLDACPPRRAVFLFDAPMSHSGLLASLYAQRLKALGISGEAQAVPVPEKLFPYGECVIASSDHVVLDRAQRWLDLARMAIEIAMSPLFTVDFSPLVLSRSIDSACLSDSDIF